MLTTQQEQTEQKRNRLRLLYKNSRDSPALFQFSQGENQGIDIYNLLDEISITQQVYLLLSDGSKIELFWSDKNEAKEKRYPLPRIFSALCVKKVLHIFEKRYPNDKRPRETIKTAILYSLGMATEEELKTAKDIVWGIATEISKLTWTTKMEYSINITILFVATSVAFVAHSTPDWEIPTTLSLSNARFETQEAFGQDAWLSTENLQDKPRNMEIAKNNMKTVQAEILRQILFGIISLEELKEKYAGSR